jgi:ribose 5-phosphate isomerase B
VRFAEIFLATPFSGAPRHVRRLALLADYEASGALPASGEAGVDGGR